MAEIFFRSRALSGFKSASGSDQIRIKTAIEILKVEQFPSHTKKLEGTPNGYRIRVGKWRILFVLSGGEVDVVDIFIKKDKADYRRRI